ncbi:MAG: hypothetical protein JO334_08335 [Verrucomicrobia bacterium]|nr:hypothetical protein [Verrucomicrobiota bacterium]
MNLPVATPHGLMVKRCPLEIIERTQNAEIGELKLDRNPVARMGHHQRRYSLA